MFLAILLTFDPLPPPVAKGYEVQLLPNMVMYRSSRYTQSIYKLNSASRIDRVPRSALLPKWQVPGGMEGVTGWRSDLYKMIPDGGLLWTGNIPVKNSFGHFQTELGHKRSYPDGTVFFDVLTNAKTNEIFEHRERRKVAGQWKSRVVYSDDDARPRGYVGLKGVSCSSCHNEAGTGGYGVGLVPGGDGVISDPFEELESPPPTIRSFLTVPQAVICTT